MKMQMHDDNEDEDGDDSVESKNKIPSTKM